IERRHRTHRGICIALFEKGARSVEAYTFDSVAPLTHQHPDNRIVYATPRRAVVVRKLNRYRTDWVRLLTYRKCVKDEDLFYSLRVPLLPRTMRGNDELAVVLFNLVETRKLRIIASGFS